MAAGRSRVDRGSSCAIHGLPLERPRNVSSEESRFHGLPPFKDAANVKRHDYRTGYSSRRHDDSRGPQEDRSSGEILNRSGSDDDWETLRPKDPRVDVGSLPLAKKRRLSPSMEVRKGGKQLKIVSRDPAVGGDDTEGTKVGEADNHAEDGNSELSDLSSESDASMDDFESSTLSPVGTPTRHVDMVQGCRDIEEFEKLNKISEGSYGIVFKARDRSTGEIVALKMVKLEREREGFPMSALREINILMSLNHPSVVNVKGVAIDSSLEKIFIIMEYMEHDLKGLMDKMKQPFTESEVKCLMLQLLKGVQYLHDNWVLHRDLKTSNLLFNDNGELKICDFGMARQYGSPLKPYTELVVTLLYRAPELLLGAKEYSSAVDIWSVGCIMAELLTKEPLFRGKSEVDQLDQIFRLLGTPDTEKWPGFADLPGAKVNFINYPCKLREKFRPTQFFGRPLLSEQGRDLLNKLLCYDRTKRITAEDALCHEWFSEFPFPTSKAAMPRCTDHYQDRYLDNAGYPHKKLSFFL